MPHHVPLITTIALGLGVAFVFGLLAVRLRLPAIVGYLVAGVVIGPATPGLAADLGIAQQLAEVGVILLMFGVGLHLSLGDLLSVKRIALPGAVVQIAVATALGTVLAHWAGWSWGSGFVFGLCLSTASTVVLLRALEERDLVESVNGRIAVGWLVVEDIAMVLALVLLPAFSGMLGGRAAPAGDDPQHWLAVVLLTLLRVGAFAALMIVVGRRVFPWLLSAVAKTGSREIFTLCVIAIAVGIAYAAAEVFGVSFALGAFFAGMVLRESRLAARAAEEILPLRDSFAVLFFVSVGMLFDPDVLLENPIGVALTVATIMFGKSIAAFGLVLAFRYPLNTALTVSASLAQIGEFAFILASLAVALELLPPDGQDLILAGALISISLNPFVFRLIEPVQRWIRARSPHALRHEQTTDPLAVLPDAVDSARVTGHVLVVGYGRVGQPIVDALVEQGVDVAVVSDDREHVEALRSRGVNAIVGDAGEPDVLVQGHVARARLLVIATPDSARAQRMIDVARTLNPGIGVVARTHSDEEAVALSRAGADQVFIGERELARGMVQCVRERCTEAGAGG